MEQPQPQLAPESQLAPEYQGTGAKFLALSNLGKNGPLRWIGGILLILFLWQIVGGICAVPFFIIGGANLFTTDPAVLFASVDPFWLYMSLSIGFLFIWLGLFIAVRGLHKRPFRTLITYLQKISWGRIAQGFVLWLLLGIVAQVVEFVIYPSRAVYTFDPSQWFRFLPFVLILTPIQTTAEELLFRGYLLQGVGRIFKNPIFLTFIGGVLFALPHMLNPEVLNNPGQTVILFLNYFVTGAVFTLYTLRDNRLELAIGAHMSNNLYAALIVNYKDSALPTPTIFTNPSLDAVFGLVTVSVISLLFYAIVFVLSERRSRASN